MRIIVLLSVFISVTTLANEKIFSIGTNEISGGELIEIMSSISPINVGSCNISNIKPICEKLENQRCQGITFDFEKSWKKKHYKLLIPLEAKVKVVHKGSSASLYYYCDNAPDSLVLELDHNMKPVSLHHYHEVSKLRRVIGKIIGSDLMLYNLCEEEEERVDQGSRSATTSPTKEISDTQKNIQLN